MTFCTKHSFNWSFSVLSIYFLRSTQTVPSGPGRPALSKSIAKLLGSSKKKRNILMIRAKLELILWLLDYQDQTEQFVLNAKSILKKIEKDSFNWSFSVLSIYFLRSTQTVPSGPGRPALSKPIAKLLGSSKNENINNKY